MSSSGPHDMHKIIKTLYFLKDALMEEKFESNEICIWEFIYGPMEGWGKKTGLKLWEQPSNLLLGLEHPARVL